MTFDYTALAELYPARNYNRRAACVTYKRFEVTAEAVRFAMKELPSEFLLGAYLEVEQERFNSKQIRLLYESKDCPLPRKPRLAAKDLEGAIGDLSKKHAISCAEVRGLIDRLGSDEKKIDAAVRRLKRTGGLGK
jgi:hypothetical protein